MIFSRFAFSIQRFQALGSTLNQREAIHFWELRSLWLCPALGLSLFPKQDLFFALHLSACRLCEEERASEKKCLLIYDSVRLSKV
jgi:hypothetical protein